MKIWNRILKSVTYIVYFIEYKLFCFFIPLCLLITWSLSAATLQVAIDGSQAYTTIQSAIDASLNGDTVLVHPGRYFENVVLDSKIITLCSMEATTNDSTYIGSTTIDGNNSGSCVRFYNQGQSGSTLRGLTIEHGTGYPFGAQSERHGGGLFVYTNSSVTVTNCIIKNNISTMGGGLFAFEASVTFRGVDIYHNQASASGGGVLLIGSRTVTPNIVFDEVNRCSIYENYSTNPCDVYVIDIMENLDFYLDMVSVPNPGDFYFGRHANFTQTQGYTNTVHYINAYRMEVNQDLFVGPDGDDNNNGFSPDTAMKTIAKAVHRIAADSTNIKTVHILPGTYTSEDQLCLPIPLKSYVNIIGGGSSITSIVVTSSMDGITNGVINGTQRSVIILAGLSISATITEPIMHIRLSGTSKNILLSDIIISDSVVNELGSILLLAPHNIKLEKVKVANVSAQEIGGVYSPDMISGSIVDCEFSNIASVFNDPDGEPMTMFDVNVTENIAVQNCVFRDFFTAPQQPALNISNGRSDNNPVDVNISNCLFSNLSSDIYRPIHFSNRSIDSFKLSNNTFINNYGWPAAVNLIGNIQLHNNIFYNPECTYELLVMNSPPIVPISNAYLDYNNIRNGIAGILSDLSNTNVYYSDTNISGNPEFYSLHSESPFFAQLTAASPCINAATPDTTGLALLPYDLAGNHRVWDGRIDMGCFEYGSESYVSNLDPVVPAIPEVNLMAYPNPFSAFTNIKVSALSSSGTKQTGVQSASITIYNIKGQRVKSIALDPRKSGEQITCWDARDADDMRCSSGVYIVNLMVNDRKVSSKKVTLIR